MVLPEKEAPHTRGRNSKADALLSIRSNPADRATHISRDDGVRGDNGPYVRMSTVPSETETSLVSQNFVLEDPMGAKQLVRLLETGPESDFRTSQFTRREDITVPPMVEQSNSRRTSPPGATTTDDTARAF